jgi:hypothetical protein
MIRAQETGERQLSPEMAISGGWRTWPPSVIELLLCRFGLVVLGKLVVLGRQRL